MKHETAIQNPTDKIQTAEEIKSEIPPFVIAEYTALRAEILQRAVFEHQLIALTLILVGTLLTIGLQPNSPAAILLIYPILVTFIAAEWSFNNMRIFQMGIYIRDELEKKWGGLGWEQFFRSPEGQTRLSKLKITGVFSARGIFVLTQLVTIGIALMLWSKFTTVEIVLLVFDGISILTTFALVQLSE